MSEYIRARDYREQQLLNMPNGQIFQKSALTADDVLAVGADHVTIAMGARWRKDVAQDSVYVTVADAGTEVLTPDDIMEGRLPTGPRVLFDGDGYYMGGVIAERVLASGQPVTLVTPLDSVSYWAQMTSERWRIRAHLMKLGVGIVTAHGFAHFDGALATLACQYSGREMVLPTKSLVVVGHRAPSMRCIKACWPVRRGWLERCPLPSSGSVIARHAPSLPPPPPPGMATGAKWMIRSILTYRSAMHGWMWG